MKAVDRVYMVDDPGVKKKLIDRNFSSIPHIKALGIEFFDLERNTATGKLPYQKQLVGNIESGALHTGVLLSLFDSIAGLAVLCALPDFEIFATLDLRLDCFKPSTVDADLYCKAECHRLTNTIAFVRGTIYHESADDPIAGCVATFFRSGKRKPILKRIGEST